MENADKNSKKERLTPEQKAAIECEGKVIVSASAGSGKTFVMIEKLVNYLCEKKDGEYGDLDDVLAITFTRKAAAQMKEKLRKRLIEKLNSLEDDKIEEKKHIKAQLGKIPTADVTTIDAFCSRLIKKYFYLIGIDPSYEIVPDDDGRMMSIVKKTLDDLIEDKYKEGDKKFLRLSSCLRLGHTDKKLKEYIRDSYTALRIIPNYIERLDEYKKRYNEDGFCELCNEYMGLNRAVLAEAKEDALNLLKNIRFENDKAYTQHTNRMKAIIETLDKLMLIDDVFADVKFETLPSISRSSYGPMSPEDEKMQATLDEFVSKVYSGKIKTIFALGGKGKSGDERRCECRDRFLSTKDQVEAFTELLLEYDARLTAAKKEENVLDYADLEHGALKILKGDYGDTKDTRAKQEIRNSYKRVYVDEYQDINELQDAFLSEICGDDYFYVGDLKQAIYGFRGSSSKFFLKKFEDMQKPGDGNALFLPHNFRSKKGILDFVNKFFSRSMSKNICDVNYAEGHEMKYGDGYEGDEGDKKDVRIHRYKTGCDIPSVDKGEKAETITDIYSVKEHTARKENKTIKRVKAEAGEIVKIVRSELGRTFFDIETGKERKITYKDICILDYKRNDAEVQAIVKGLRDANLPVSSPGDDNICERAEIKKITDILSYIDNSEQDIGLIAFMLSPLGGFCEDDLARIKIAFRKKKLERYLPGYVEAKPDDKRPSGHRDYRQCLDAYKLYIEDISENDENCKADPLYIKIVNFYNVRDRYRYLSEILGAASLIDVLMDEEGWEAGFCKDGGVMLKGVRALQSAAFSGGQELGLSAFLRKLADADYKIECPDSAATDSINVMTMHSSKGLEFPVVIITDVYSSFLGKASTVPFDRQYGYISKWYDDEKGTTGDTFLKTLSDRKEKLDDIKNKLNLFYVATTRAMVSLHILASGEGAFFPGMMSYATSFSQLGDFSDPDYLADDTFSQQRPEGFSDVSGEDVTTDKDDESMLSSYKTGPAIDAVYEVPYSHLESVKLPTKGSASVIVHEKMQEAGDMSKLYYTENIIEGKDYLVKDENGALAIRKNEESGAETGTAYHKFLEICDLSVKDKNDIEKELAQLSAEGRMSEKEIKLLDAGNLEKILSMNIFGGLFGEIYKEKMFLCNISAHELDESVGCDDEILMQGKIDLLVLDRKNGKAKIVDYKYSNRSDAAIVETYLPQIKLYKKVVSKLCDIDEKNIETAIVNIKQMRELTINV